MLHRADRHLVYPPGGLDELRRRDPMRIAEERERQARMRRGGSHATDGPADSTILGLNIRLDTPELVDEWIRQRRKRFPTAANMEQKRKDAERPTRRGTEWHVSVPNDSDTSSDASESDSSAAGTSDSDESDSSSSDGPPESASTRIEPSPRPDTRSVCRFYAQGHCSYGEQCRYLHDESKRPAPADEPATKRRRMPRPPPPNPFAVPDLLHQLLQTEIVQHVDKLAQLIQFVLDNDMLRAVERQVGDAETQRQRRARVVVVASVEADGAADDAETGKAPRNALLRPPSPALRALSELRWPPEPDPLIYLDPLRANDPKPLRPEELEALATDPKVRDILCPTTTLKPHGEVNEPLRRALETWDALPTSRHREAALQLILGVSAQSPMHAHEAYASPALRTRATPRAYNMQQGRVIGETELFRLGLRVGPTEVRLIQHLAERVAAVTSGLEYK